MLTHMPPVLLRLRCRPSLDHITIWNQDFGDLIVNGFVYIFGSSMVTLKSMWP